MFLSSLKKLNRAFVARRSIFNSLEKRLCSKLFVVRHDGR
jgi:hypothetical protein